MELRVTLEAFGHTHKRAILDALCGAGYAAREMHANDFSLSPAGAACGTTGVSGEPFPRIRLYDAARFLRGMGRRAGAAWGAGGGPGRAPGVIRLVYLMLRSLRLPRPAPG